MRDAAADLRQLFPDGVVRTNAADLVARSVDASIYRLMPQAVVHPRHVDDVRRLLAYATRSNRHVTFRGAGTSLSGQAVGDDIVAEIGAAWRGVRVLENGERVWAQPGAIGGHVNRVLASRGRRIGPDPASIDSATIGGILANNASGMCCGTQQNSYQTLDALTLVLADGTVVDTAVPGADARFRALRPSEHASLLSLRDRLRSDPATTAKIRRVFSLKNTTGYALHAFLDYDAPAEILAHLMVGSQGTLGFVAEAILRTIAEPPLRATALLLFEDLPSAGEAVGVLRERGALAVEILDAAALRAQEHERPAGRLSDDSAALLVEIAATEEEALRATAAELTRELRRFRLAADVHFSEDPAERERMWRLRKGLFPAIGGRRPAGTALVIEDVAVPADRLAAAILDLQGLFVRHALTGTAIFGHAKDGNLHFVLAEDFSRTEAVHRYAAFMEDLVALIVGRYDGALKAEHGSGRNMAPFVKAQWGERPYSYMWEVKHLLDPHGILNPGVVLCDDDRTHLKNLKTLPPVSPLVDSCIECGFCEPRCPSRDVTLSPRQRIAVLRELARPEIGPRRRELENEYAYAGIDTCVGDGLCQTSCPVAIDTGAAMKELRARSHPSESRAVAIWAADHMGLALAMGRAALRMTALAGSFPGGRRALESLSRLGHAVLPQLLPRIDRDTVLPRAAPHLPPPRPQPGAREVVYFPSCLARLLGSDPGDEAPGIGEALLDACAAAGLSVRLPRSVTSLCCGLAFSSRGFPEAARRARERTTRALAIASDGGRIPVVTDASPCAAAMAEAEPGVLDFPSFWARHVLPHAPPLRRRQERVLIHPTCSTRRSGGVADLLAVARACADDVQVPFSAECCGFAGDRGFFFPEVTAAALAGEAEEVRALLTPGAGLYSTSRTCELGIGRAVGAPCRSLVHLVREALLG